MIRIIFNDDEVWRRTLRGLNSKYRHQTVTYENIVNYICEQYGKDLLPVFDQYLHHQNVPILEMSVINGQLNSRWIADVKDFNMPAPIKIDGGEYQLIYPSTKFTPVNLKGDSEENLLIDTFNFYIGVLKN